MKSASGAALGTKTGDRLGAEGSIGRAMEARRKLDRRAEKELYCLKLLMEGAWVTQARRRRQKA